ncbi:MAG TPA: nuclear transport factor 2 family protein [Acidimicrobiales bacterium]|nr:nuclear transport factor 2 family protein [Acidimicrobiales bacterium]
MPLTENSTAVGLARAHVKTWSDQNWDAARAALAADVHVIVTSTDPNLPVTDTTGPDDYMVGLEYWATKITPGSVKEVNAIGDDKYALLTITVEVDFGFGKVTSPGARLYRFDDSNKIAAEQVIFFIGS